MEKVKGFKCRECGRGYPAGPVHVCEFCFGPLEVDYDYDALREAVTRDSIAAGPASMWRYRDLLDALYGRLEAHVQIRPSLSAFDRALADLESQTVREG